MREASENYLQMPKVTIDGRTFVDKEYFVDKAIMLIEDCQKTECYNKDEKDGMQQAIIVLQNM